MEGRETELDKTIIEAIKDPLTHIIRNSVDHGIEAPRSAWLPVKVPRAGCSCALSTKAVRSTLKSSTMVVVSTSSA